MTGLRVAQLCADRGIAPGGTKGAALHLRDLAEAVARRGHAVTTFAARRGGDWPVPLRRLAPTPAGVARQVPRGATVYERYSLGHTHGLDAARARGARFVLEVNAPLVDEATMHRPGTVSADDVHAERHLMREADAVVAVSEPLRQWCAQLRGSDEETYAIENGFAPTRFAVAAEGSPRDPVIAFLGHPKPWHGADRLPQLAAALLRRKIPVTVRIIGGGPGAEHVRELAGALGVADRFDITGAVPPDRAAALLRDADVAVAPYPRHEFFYFCPLKLLDYMAAGLAIVASDQGDIARLLGGTGVLVDPDRFDELCDAVGELCADPARRGQLGGAARARAFANFTWDHVAARLDAALWGGAA